MYTLAIEDTVDVPVKFTLKEKSVNKLFSFTLTATRVPLADINAAMEACEFKFKEALQKLDVLKGWNGQRLVLDEQKNPADFNADSLDMMLTVQGVAQVVYLSYLKECGAKEKN